MKTSSTKSTTPVSISNLSVLKIGLGILLMFACSQVSIPIKPVPITLQSVGTLIIALTYNRREGVLAMASFLALGATAVPMFAKLSGGIGVLFGTTGGYLFGMLLAVFVVTTMRERFGEDSITKLFAYSVVGTICIFLLGLPVLWLYVGSENLLAVGVMPFIIPGLVKACFVASTIRLFNNAPWKKRK